jgi:hypothetical protein
MAQEFIALLRLFCEITQVELLGRKKYKFVTDKGSLSDKLP